MLQGQSYWIFILSSSSFTSFLNTESKLGSTTLTRQTFSYTDEKLKNGWWQWRWLETIISCTVGESAACKLSSRTCRRLLQNHAADQDCRNQFLSELEKVVEWIEFEGIEPQQKNIFANIVASKMWKFGGFCCYLFFYKWLESDFHIISQLSHHDPCFSLLLWW